MSTRPTGVEYDTEIKSRYTISVGVNIGVGIEDSRTLRKD